MPHDNPHKQGTKISFIAPGPYSGYSMSFSGQSDQPASTQSRRRNRRPSPSVSNSKKYLTEQEVSEITGRSLSTLRKDRHFGRGIPYSKIGRQVRYASKDVDSYMESCRIETRPI